MWKRQKGKRTNQDSTALTHRFIARNTRHTETEKLGESLRNGLFIKVWAGLGKPPWMVLIFRASDSRGEVQSLEGQGVREVTRNQRGEGHRAGALWACQHC